MRHSSESTRGCNCSWIHARRRVSRRHQRMAFIPAGSLVEPLEHGGDDAVAARAGEPEYVGRRACPCRASSASRSSARARNSRVRTVAGGMPRHSAVSCDRHLLDLAHHEDGAKRDRQSSIRRSMTFADFAAQHRVGRAIRPSRPAGRSPCRRVSRAARRRRPAERHDDRFALALAQPHQRLVDDDAREPGAELRVAAELRRCAGTRGGRRPGARPRRRHRPSGSRARPGTAGRCGGA